MLLEMMHFDFETQYTLKIPNLQDLVKFNSIHIRNTIINSILITVDDHYFFNINHECL